MIYKLICMRIIKLRQLLLLSVESMIFHGEQVTVKALTHGALFDQAIVYTRAFTHQSEKLVGVYRLIAMFAHVLG